MTETQQDTKASARLAVFILKEATLKVLYEAGKCGDGPIQPLEIRKRLGLPKADEPGAAANTLIFGILYYLATDGSVEHVDGHGWRMTDETAALFDSISTAKNEVYRMTERPPGGE